MLAKLLRIYEKKWHGIYNLFSKKKGNIALQPSLQKLKLLISSQIRVLKKLEKANASNPFLSELRKVLEQQKKLFSKAKITGILSNQYSKTISAMEDEAIHLLKKEQELVLRISKVSEQKVPSTKKKAVIRLSKKQAAYAAKAIVAVNKSIRDVSDAVGNRKEVQRAAKLLLKHLARLQHTEVYGFLKEDAANVRKAAKAILENPREARIRHMLASLYLVAPFTFDATGAVIVLRYAAKYANSKSKRLQARIKAMRDKRKRHLRVFE